MSGWRKVDIGIDDDGNILYSVDGDATEHKLANKLAQSGDSQSIGNTEPSDESLSEGDLVIWFDKTDGNSFVNFKGKTEDGTVVSASVPVGE